MKYMLNLQVVGLALIVSAPVFGLAEESVETSRPEEISGARRPVDVNEYWNQVEKGLPESLKGEKEALRQQLIKAKDKAAKSDRIFDKAAAHEAMSMAFESISRRTTNFEKVAFEKALSDVQSYNPKSVSGDAKLDAPVINIARDDRLLGESCDAHKSTKQSTLLDLDAIGQMDSALGGAPVSPVDYIESYTNLTVEKTRELNKMDKAFEEFRNAGLLGSNAKVISLAKEIGNDGSVNPIAVLAGENALLQVEVNQLHTLQARAIKDPYVAELLDNARECESGGMACNQAQYQQYQVEMYKPVHTFIVERLKDGTAVFKFEKDCVGSIVPVVAKAA